MLATEPNSVAGNVAGSGLDGLIGTWGRSSVNIEITSGYKPIVSGVSEIMSPPLTVELQAPSTINEIARRYVGGFVRVVYHPSFQCLRFSISGRSKLVPKTVAQKMTLADCHAGITGQLHE